MARTLAEARAECLAERLGPFACMDRIDPFCGANENAAVDLDVDGGLAFCKPESSLSPAKARVLLNEARDRQAALAGPSSWVLIGAGVVAASLLVWLVAR